MDFKYPMYLGAIFLVLSQCLAGLTSQIWQLFLTQGVMFGIVRLLNNDYGEVKTDEAHRVWA